VRTRRVVEESGLVPRGGRPRLWAYGYQDLAELFGVKVRTVREWVAQGWEPDLAAVCERYHERARDKAPVRLHVRR